MKFAVITFPQCLDTDAGTAAGPKALLQVGLADWLREQGHDVAGTFDETLVMITRAAFLLSRFPATLFSSLSGGFSV